MYHVLLKGIICVLKEMNGADIKRHMLLVSLYVYIVFFCAFRYHLRLFEDSATRHYRKSSQLFYDTPVKAPALIFIAKNDPVASYDTVVKLKEYWESLGRKVL